MRGDGIIRDETGAQRTLGYVLDVSAGDGRARCLLTLDGRHTNRHGALHGGITAAMLDNAMGATASLSVDTETVPPVLTLSMTTNYIASANAGDRLTAIGRLTGGGRTVKYVDGELRRDDGTLVATATGVFRTMPTERAK